MIKEKHKISDLKFLNNNIKLDNQLYYKMFSKTQKVFLWHSWYFIVRGRNIYNLGYADFYRNFKLYPK